MLVRVNMPGVPDSRDPALWPFPTAGLYSYDPVGGTAIFDVPDTDAPPNPPAAGAAGRPNTPAGPVITQMTAADVTAWRNKLVGMYPNNARVANLAVK